MPILIGAPASEPAAIAAKGYEPLATPALSRAARPRRAPAPVSPKRPDAKETLRLVLGTLDDMKAEDIVTLNLTGKTSFCDFMVVATGRSQRHVGSTADNVVKDLNKAGIREVRIEGIPQCDWVLIDAGDVIVHVFRDEVRTFYNLEKMWTGSPPADRPVN